MLQVADDSDYFAPFVRQLRIDQLQSFAYRALVREEAARQVAADDHDFCGPAVIAIREGAAFDQRGSQRTKIIGTGGDEPRVPQAAAVIRIRRPLRGETCDALPIDR